MISEDIKKRVLELAVSAPNVHNVQPWKWTFFNDVVELHLDATKMLAVADPVGRDVAISLGCAWKTMKISLSHFGLQVSDENIFSLNNFSNQLIASATIISAAKEHDLFSYIGQRRTYRGKFKQADFSQLESLKLFKESHEQWAFETEIKTIKLLASAYDNSSYFFLKKKEYMEELYHWMRFSKEDKRWNEDGLNADAMSLSSLEAALAKTFLKPNNFQSLVKLGFGKMLISEAPQIISASAVAFFKSKIPNEPFAWGEQLMEDWLRLTQLGFSLCPLSALTDDKENNHHLLQQYSKSDESIVLAFRVGIAPSTVYKSPRKKDLIFKIN
jgi:hypothetical protein